MDQSRSQQRQVDQTIQEVFADCEGHQWETRYDIVNGGTIITHGAKGSEAYRFFDDRTMLSSPDPVTIIRNWLAEVHAYEAKEIPIV